jgi:hypothetical protein
MRPNRTRRGPSVLPPSPAPAVGLEFEEDVKPLFRERDRASRLSVAKFDLWQYDDVSKHSSAILGRLEDGSMPCDQPWPDDQVETFRR